MSQARGRSRVKPAAGSGPSADEWTTEVVLAYLREHGRVIEPVTWYSYVSRGQAPKPKRRVGRTPVWEPDVIRAYQAAWQRERRHERPGAA